MRKKNPSFMLYHGTFLCLPKKNSFFLFHMAFFIIPKSFLKKKKININVIMM